MFKKKGLYFEVSEVYNLKENVLSKVYLFFCLPFV